MRKHGLVYAVSIAVLAIPLSLGLVDGYTMLTEDMSQSGASPGQPTSVQGRAYVANAEDGTVSIIDLGSNSVVGTIKVGEGASHGIAVSRDGRYLYTGNYPGNQLVIIDLATRQTVAAIDLGAMAHGIDISCDGRFVYAGGRYERGGTVGQVAVIDASTNEIVRYISGSEGTAAHMDFSPDGRHLYIASVATDSVWVVDTDSGQVVVQIPVGKGPNEVAVALDGRRAYSANVESNDVTIIDLERNVAIATVPGAINTHGIRVRPNSNEVWIANWSGTVSILDTASQQIIQSIPMGEYANHIAFTQDGQYAYVSRQQDLAVINAPSRQIVATIPVGNRPHEISLVETASTAHGGGQSPLAIQQTMPPAGDVAAMTRRDSGAGRVTAEAVWVVPENVEALRSDLKDLPLDLDRKYAFLVKFNTHSVNLLAYDVLAQALMRDGQGMQAQAGRWDGISNDSHHRSGVLQFPRDSGVGAGGYVELVLSGLAGIPERVLRWDLAEG